MTATTRPAANISLAEVLICAPPVNWLWPEVIVFDAAPSLEEVVPFTTTGVATDPAILLDVAETNVFGPVDVVTKPDVV